MSIHINAKPGEIAESVLLPGDPLRAKWIAETFLEEAFCYNDIRGMLGYTGTYKGKRISVQGTGMGIPSALIYCTELIRDYGVKKLIRVGSAGSYQPDIKLHDIVIAMAASSTSGINNSRFVNADYSPTANFDLFIKAATYAKNNNIPIKAGNVLSADEFYSDDVNHYKQWADYGVLCVEMEAAGIYTIAAKYKVQALAILTISDSLVSKKEISYCEKRKNSGAFYAKRFAAKEAFSKALGTGFSQGVFWKDISVENNKLGKPVLKLTGNANKVLKKLVPKNKKPLVNITITDENEVAYAMVIISFN